MGGWMGGWKDTRGGACGPRPPHRTLKQPSPQTPPSITQRAIAAPADPLLSPYLTEAVLWLLTRWARTYLLPDPK